MHAYKISIMFVKEIKYQYVQFFLIKGELVRVLWKSWSWDVMLIHLNTSAQQMPCRKNLPKILHNFTTSRFKLNLTWHLTLTLLVTQRNWKKLVVTYMHSSLCLMNIIFATHESFTYSWKFLFLQNDHVYIL